VRAGGLGELVWLLPRLAGLIARLVQDGRVSPRAKATLGLATLYLASPIDLVPDFVPFLGYLDDALVVAIILDGLLNQVDHEILREHWPGDPASLERAGRVAARLAVWVPRRLKARLFGGPAA
jgi:uncharacterized membrane protein YkvA (DUF1232 family)